MSSALGLAATAAAIQQILLAGFAKLKLDDVLGETAQVTCISPPLFEQGSTTSHLNLFLYNQTRNTGLSNEGLPSRDSRGERIANPALAIDLHYLITAHAKADFHAEVLLGAAMQILHETPALGREAIRNALKPDPVNKPGLPKQLSLAGLADQVEQLRITPLNHTDDEVARIWSAIQVPGRPGAAYLVSVLLLESALSTRVALPVAERRLYTLPLRTPRIDRVESDAGAATPIVPSGVAIIRGANLRAKGARLLLNGLDFTAGITEAKDDSLKFRFTWPAPPTVPGELRAGTCTAQIAHPVLMGEPAAPHAAFDSNLGVFVLNPEATFVVAPGSTSKVVAGVTYRSGQVVVTCVPKLGVRQRVRLILNEKEPPSDRPARGYTFAAADGNGIVAPAESTDSVSVSFRDVAAGNYLARVQVDEGSSSLELVAGKFSGPSVVA